MHSDYIVEQNFIGLTYTENGIKFKEYENCTFTKCDFTACSFLAVTFIDCNFFECNFRSTKINHVSLRNVWFTKCDFTHVNFSMTDQVLYEFHFRDTLLDYAQFYSLKLKKMQFINCSMVATDFMESDLSEALFDHCNLRHAVFIGTIANKTDFFTSYDFIIDPEKNKLKRALFSKDNCIGLLKKYDVIIK